LKWVYADYDNRVKYCKTGWKSWDKYSSLPTEVYYDKVYNNNYICLKCGEKIKYNSRVKVIKVCCGDNISIYLHNKC